MSQLIDKLNRVAKPVSQPMGFRAVQAATPKARMLLIASPLPSENLNGLGDSGADAVLLHIAALETVQKLARSPAGIPWGAWSRGDEKEINAIVEGGSDFVVFPADSPLPAMPQSGKVGKVLQVEPSLNEGLLRAINDLPADAVLITDATKIEGPLTWQHLMSFQRTAALLAKPLLVSVPTRLTASELQALWDIGIDGVVIEVSKGQMDRLGELRQAIGNLTDSSRRKRGKAEALLPSIRMEAPVEAEEEEGDE